MALMLLDGGRKAALLRRTAVARGVASAVLGNWQAWRGCLSDLFWIRPSWILCGVSNGRRPD